MSLRDQITNDMARLYTDANLGDTVSYRDGNGVETAGFVGSVTKGDHEAKPAVIHDGYLGDAHIVIPVSQIETIDEAGFIIEADGTEWKIYKTYKPDAFAHLVILTTLTNRPARPSLRN